MKNFTNQHAILLMAGCFILGLQFAKLNNQLSAENILRTAYQALPEEVKEFVFFIDYLSDAIQEYPSLHKKPFFSQQELQFLPLKKDFNPFQKSCLSVQPSICTIVVKKADKQKQPLKCISIPSNGCVK
ncbi:MAG: hypothetical protein AAFO07_25865, partial [Bacteroidota bacterium]